MDEPSDRVVSEGYCPERLVENNPIAKIVHILPSAGLYLERRWC